MRWPRVSAPLACQVRWLFGGRMFVDPMRTGSFGVSGHLVMAGTFEIGEADYWYHTPYFWLVKENGEVIFREGRGREDIGQGDPARALRMLSKPVFFADKLGFRMESHRSEERRVGKE